MEEKKTFEQWEEAYNCIMLSAAPELLTTEMTEQEFIDYRDRNLKYHHGVMHEMRKDFLQQNGYDVNRANMTDRELSSRG